MRIAKIKDEMADKMKADKKLYAFGKENEEMITNIVWLAILAMFEWGLLILSAKLFILVSYIALWKLCSIQKYLNLTTV